jgi:hypothetical protein
VNSINQGDRPREAQETQKGHRASPGNAQGHSQDRQAKDKKPVWPVEKGLRHRRGGTRPQGVAQDVFATERLTGIRAGRGARTAFNDVQANVISFNAVRDARQSPRLTVETASSRVSVSAGCYLRPAGAATLRVSAPGGTVRITQQSRHSKVRSGESAPQFGDVLLNCMSPWQ